MFIKDMEMQKSPNNELLFSAAHHQTE